VLRADRNEVVQPYIALLLGVDTSTVNVSPAANPPVVSTVRVLFPNTPPDADPIATPFRFTVTVHPSDEVGDDQLGASTTTRRLDELGTDE